MVGKPDIGAWLVQPQPRLGTGGLVLLMVLGSLVAPLSLDMYTPAVPHMAEWFGTTPDAVNLTLMGYFLFLAVGLLVFGPLSDKYGRRACWWRALPPTAWRASPARWRRASGCWWPPAWCRRWARAP